ncbi:MAG: hypothetical protein QGI93_11060, partial [Planctomycetota bacterium]|nr:hypothetical protein [Planctomycetota bacterium]
HARAARGGDRRVGRKLCDLLQRAGFANVQAKVVPITPTELPLAELCELAFSHQAALLDDMAGTSMQDQRCLQELQRLPEQPGAWVCLPVVVAWGDVPGSTY